MSFTNANKLLHDINQLYLNADPPVLYDYNKYVNYYLFNCTDQSNVSFLISERASFTNTGTVLYTLVNFAVNLCNDLANTTLSPNNLITNFFTRLVSIRSSFPTILTGINFGAYIRDKIMLYAKNESASNKLILFNSIQNIMSNSTTYLEYSLVSKLNTTTPQYQTCQLMDSLKLADTYETLPSVDLTLTNNGVSVNGNISVNTSNRNILSDYQDNELVPAKMLKYISYDPTTKTVSVDGMTAFYFK